MNFAAIRGREGIKERPHGDLTILHIDGSKVQFWDYTVNNLGYFGRRKFENMLTLEQPKKKLIFKYE